MIATEREKLVEAIADPGKLWDIIVVGGGATGLGTALDAASRGYKTVLFEQADFAKGTSSRSTKLVHGGVRYLAQGDIGLVREALYERGLLLKNAAHLVKNEAFIIPVYDWWRGNEHRHEPVLCYGLRFLLQNRPVQIILFYNRAKQHQAQFLNQLRLPQLQ